MESVGERQQLIDLVVDQKDLKPDLERCKPRRARRMWRT
jgi:hypothetical protein